VEEGLRFLEDRELRRFCFEGIGGTRVTSYGALKITPFAHRRVAVTMGIYCPMPGRSPADYEALSSQHFIVLYGKEGAGPTSVMSE
jgi:hypothetical protein